MKAAAAAIAGVAFLAVLFATLVVTWIVTFTIDAPWWVPASLGAVALSWSAVCSKAVHEELGRSGANVFAVLLIVCSIIGVILVPVDADAQTTEPTLADVIVIGTHHHPFFRCVRAHESDEAGGYTAQNPSGDASGAYQFLDSTWRGVWVRLLDREPPTREAWRATPYDQGLAAGVAFIHGEQSHWRGTGCGYGT